MTEDDRDRDADDDADPAVIGPETPGNDMTWIRKVRWPDDDPDDLSDS
jgi:hypothetical protein